MSKCVQYTGIKLPDLNAELYVETEDENINIGIATPPPERPGDEPMLVSLIKLCRNEKGQLVSNRFLLPANRRLRVLQKIGKTQIGVTARDVILDLRTEELCAQFRHQIKTIVTGAEVMHKEVKSDNTAEKFLELIAMATELDVHYKVYRNPRNNNALSLKVWIDDQEEECPIEAGAYQYDTIKSAFDMLKKKQEEEKKRQEIQKQALAKLTPEERQALGYSV